MSNYSPIPSPPPKLMQQWAAEYWNDPNEPIGNGEKHIAIQAAQWGADQELEACCEWVSPFSHDDCHYEDKLRAARRPKAPSLKEEALSLLDEFSDPEGLYLDVKSHNTIRRALEQLDD